MAFLHTKSGNSFVIRPSREFIEGKGKTRAEISKSIKDDAQNYGDFCHIKELDGNYAVAFNGSKGCLLGESIARYFDYPKNLIWCEEIHPINAKKKDGKEPKRVVAVVIILDGLIMLDTEMTASTLAADISLSLGTGKKFIVRTFGNVPIKEEDVSVSVKEDDKEDDVDTDQDVVYLSEERVETFLELKAGILELIEPHPEDYLKSLYKATSDAGLASKTWLYLLMVLAVTVAGYWIYHESIKKPTIVIIDNFLEYRQQLMSPDPYNILIAAVNKGLDVYDLSQWELKTITLSGNEGVNYIVSSSSPNYQNLAEFAINNQFTLNVEGTEAGLDYRIPAELSKRTDMDKQVQLESILYPITDSIFINPIFKLTSISPKISSGFHKTQDLEILVSDASFNDIIWLAEHFKNTPTVLSSFQFTAKGFSLSGSIKFKIYGY
ncbi:MAG: hypothetical protein ACJAS1_002481 [Oleiphilaceae bacterium]|jgi:hypothetical protein